MEIIECQKGGQEGWKYGEGGTCYVGPQAKQRAMQDRGRALGEQYSVTPKESTVEFLQKHQNRVQKEKQDMAKVKEAIENDQIEDLDTSDFDKKGPAYKTAQQEKEKKNKDNTPAQPEEEEGEEEGQEEGENEGEQEPKKDKDGNLIDLDVNIKL